ncbi:MAG: urate hydroxylase PuuD [Clostridia bacterium]|nr:urate hydroxylase PuuD [Deltaproteobacteria bacterium]
MGAYLLEWAAMLTRWVHLITGVAWIGASFYFIWLDNSLKAPTDPALKEKGVSGELWAVHGGGFYNPQKYMVAPAALPADLHWFKWEAYSTWISGFLLLTWVYYFNASAYLIDQTVLDISPMTAIAISLGALVAGWLVYDLLCRSPISKSTGLFVVLGFALVIASAWSFGKVFIARAAYLHVGAMLGTMMAANVLFVIIPGQKRVVAAMKRGETPNPEDGRRGKQRSVHNNYLTLPVLFIMVSNHFPMTYQHPRAWLVLAVIMVAAVLIRHFFNLRHKGRVVLALPASAGVLFFGLIIAMRPAPEPVVESGPPVTMEEVQSVIAQRCSPCHAKKPTHPGVYVPPQGLVFDNAQVIDANAERIYRQVVDTQAMPQGNVTGITKEERAAIGRWYRSREKN